MRFSRGTRLSTVFRWSGAVVFFTSLGFTLVHYETTMVRASHVGLDYRAIAFNVVLFAVFALHHSVFARLPVRATVQKLVSPALERSVYVWIASALLVVVVALWRPVPGVLWQASGIGAWSLRAAQAFGIWLTLRSAAIIDVFELAGLGTRTALPDTARSAESDRRGAAPQHNAAEFKTTGPYGWVRHPIYSGWFIIVFCHPTMTATRFTFAVVSGLYLLLGIALEERTLRTSTDGAYDRYIARVRWRLLPHVY